MNEQLLTLGGIAGRIALTYVGAVATQNGWADQVTVDSITEQVTGAAIIAATAYWSWSQKKRAKAELKG